MYRFTRRRAFKRTTLISVFFLATLIGLFIAQYGLKLSLWWLLVLPLLLLVAYKRGYGAMVAVVIIGLVAGLTRGSHMYSAVAKYQPLYNQKITFSGNVSDDPGYDEARNQTVFNLQNIMHEQTSLPGKIQVKVRGQSSDLSRGDKVVLSGKLRSSLGSSRQGSITATEIKILQQKEGVVEELRADFFSAVNQALPEPQASIGLGYLVGARVNIPKDISDQLALVGLTHIVAVSGYNLTIIIQAVRRLIAKRSAYQSVVLSLVLVGGFVVIAGGSPPINRAAVVSTFSLLAWYFGREFKPVLLLLLSGFVTGLYNPLYVWGDPSWYLSFLAFAGILVLAPILQAIFFRTKSPGIVTGILLETISAQALTVPYSLYLFGGVSVIAPLANVLILPSVPFIMLMMFAVGCLGMVSSALAELLAFVPSSLITLQLWLVEKLSNVSWAHSEMEITLSAMVVLFALLTLVIVGLGLATKRINNQQMDPDIIKV